MPARTILLFFATSLVATIQAHATTLPPELKAYDFAQAYYIEDGGVVIVPYNHGFHCDDGIETPEGIRIMPGKKFVQFENARPLVDEYKLLFLNRAGTRAYFRERSYRYQIVKDTRGKRHAALGREVAMDEFYLTRFRGLEWFDFAFPNIEIHPGEQGWRTRPQY
ncbi:MAG TPA: hypothetical protein VL981_05140 [Candidatus Methylacidiphilales bacterium]|nr:hypothetical protein [Candidatus Methylacidiphilales bacterium]